MTAIATSSQTYSNVSMAKAVLEHNNSGEPTCIVLRIPDQAGEITVFDSKEGRDAYAETVGLSDSGDFSVTLDLESGETETVAVAWGRA